MINCSHAFRNTDSILRTNQNAHTILFIQPETNLDRTVSLHMNAGFKGEVSLRTIQKEWFKRLSHSKRKQQKPKKEESRFLDYELRKNFDIVCERLRTSEEPVHLLSTLLEMFKHDLNVLCRMMDASITFCEAFDNPACFTHSNIDQTLTLFALILSETDCVTCGFNNAVHHVVPFLNDEKRFSTASDVIMASIRGNHVLADELIFESDVIGVMSESITQDGGDLLHRTSLAELFESLAKHASPETLARVKDRLLSLLETLLHVEDGYILHLCCMSGIYLLCRAAVTPKDVLFPGFVDYICTLHDVPKSLFGMLNTALCCDNACFDGSTGIACWAAGKLTDVTVQKLAMRLLANMSMVSSCNHVIVREKIADHVFGIWSELAYESKDDFFVFFCNVVMNPSYVADYDRCANIFQELCDVMTSSASIWLWKSFLAMMNSFLDARDRLQLIQSVEMIQILTAMETSGLPSDILEQVNLLLVSMKKLTE